MPPAVIRFFPRFTLIGCAMCACVAESRSQFAAMVNVFANFRENYRNSVKGIIRGNGEDDASGNLLCTVTLSTVHLKYSICASTYTSANLGDSWKGMERSLLEQSSGPSSSSTRNPNSSHLEKKAWCHFEDSQGDIVWLWQKIAWWLPVVLLSMWVLLVPLYSHIPGEHRGL